MRPLPDPPWCPLTYACARGPSITAYCEEHRIDAEACVREMRETVHRETQLTVSAGIAPNKVRARQTFPLPILRHPLLISVSRAPQMLAKVTPSVLSVPHPA